MKIQQIKSKMSFEKLVFGGILCFAFLYPFFNNSNLNLSFTRIVSRLIGKLGNCKLPLFIRSTVLNGYIKVFNVNKEEILDQELNNYETVKDFFIRKINVNKSLSIKLLSYLILFKNASITSLLDKRNFLKKFL